MKDKIRILLFLFMINTAWVYGNGPAALDCSSYFTWEVVPGTDGLIQFSNQSTGQFNTWMWDFGDGMTSGVYSSNHQFSGIGSYIVCLTVSDGGSCYDTFCDTIEIAANCQADFNITYVPTTPALVQFTDLSTGFPDSWYWLFGDGTSSTEQNPAHSYYDPGTYEVCLIIHHTDSLNNCLDSICKTVIIPDSLDCEAFFSYDHYEDDPLEVHFFDHSVGNITDWEWDFGDGTVSNIRNPVHTYVQSGEYLVCLKVENSDTTANCLHFVCETMILDDSVHCEADFSVIADSSSHVMYQYSFNDQSSGNPDGWLWDFGDGNYSQEQNPVHVYADEGTYQICLNSWNSNFPGCNDSYCRLIKTANYFQLGGLAFIGENPLNNPYPTGDTGIAIIYRQKDDLSIVAVDTNIFHELGYYWFSNMMELDYMVRISLSTGSDHYESFIPSYFPGAMSWQAADVFELNDNLFEMNTSLIEAQGAGIGPGRIKGRVAAANRYTIDGKSSFRDVPVILTDEASTPLEWTLTDEFGQFYFNDLAYGNYLLHADVAGIWSQAETVILNEGFPVHDTVLIKMYEGAPFAVDEQIEQLISITSLYPNPASDHLNMLYYADRNTNMQLDIINLTGQTVYSHQHLVMEGPNTIRISTDNMPDGLYLLSLKWNGQKQLITKKFIKN